MRSNIRHAPVMELVDMRDLGSRAFSVWVRVPSGAPERNTMTKSHGVSFQSVKERQFSLCESWRFSRIKEEIGQKNKEIRAAPLPEGQFFEIHSSIFKPHPC